MPTPKGGRAHRMSGGHKGALAKRKRLFKLSSRRSEPLPMGHGRYRMRRCGTVSVVYPTW